MRCCERKKKYVSLIANFNKELVYEILLSVMIYQ